jgi:NosR/NirI family nitrous oxide reductase transcriptional regulator
MPKPNVRRFLRKTPGESKPPLRNMKTRRTARIRLVLVILLLISLIAWEAYAFRQASEAAASAAAAAQEENDTISSDLYKLSGEVLLNVTKPIVQGSQGSYQFVKSHENPAYYMIVEHDRVSGQNITEGYVYVTTDVAPGWSYGYSGPISILVTIDTKGVVLSLRVLSEGESRPGDAFEAPWLSTLIGKSVLGNYSVGKDIDAVSGATYTSFGIVNGIREGGRAVLKDVELSSAPPPLPPTLTERLVIAFSNLTAPTDYFQSLILLTLIVVSVVGISKKIELLRYVVLLSSLLLMEFMGTRMISIEEILTLKNLTLPPIQGNLFWYLLLGSAFFLSLIWGRVYCGWLCPFGAVTEFLNMLAKKLPWPKSRLSTYAKRRVVKPLLSRLLSSRLMFLISVRGKAAHTGDVFKRLSGKSLQFTSKIPLPAREKAFLLKYVVLAGVVWGALIAGNLAITEVEPFATFFLGEGTIWMWLLLIVVLVASLRVNRAFCRYICPTGAMLSLLSRLRIREIKRWSDCATCRICERDCIMGGIQGDRIPAADCFNCGACERNYENTEGCPHWLRLRSTTTATSQATDFRPNASNNEPIWLRSSEKH